MTFKPMLAATAPADLEALRYPLLASPKLDGIRCCIFNRRAISRNLKLIPNVKVREALAGLPEGIDGELMVEGGFNECQSFFMSREAEPRDWWLFAFDYRTVQCEYGGGIKQLGFRDRLAALTTWSEAFGNAHLSVVEHVLIASARELEAYEAEQLERGFEGVMIRDPNGPYKFGRSTLREGGLLKVKRFVDEEAVVVGVEEMYHNDNEATTDALGRTRRSAHQENKRPAGVLGKLHCVTPDGANFAIGTGFTMAQRVEFWERPYALVNKRVTYKYPPMDGPRQPGQVPRGPAVFKGFRHEDDLL